MIRPGFSGSLERVLSFADRLDAGRPGSPAPEVQPFGFSGVSGIARDIEFLLAAADPEETALLRTGAARVRDERCGARVAVRGLVEFSSCCRNTCLYCGLNRNNAKAERYQLSTEEILACAALVAGEGIGTVVLQSGEDHCAASWLAEAVSEIKSRFGLAVTLSVGERSRQDYLAWRMAGADRYLLRVESSDPALYASLHRGRSLATRLRCLDDLRDLGYQVGSGIMVGVPGQTLSHIAGDILFFAERDFDMIGIGPFIPHPDTPFAGNPAGAVGLTLNAVALSRIVLRDSWMPATTALGSLDRDWRSEALRSGANVLMPNFSPAAVKGKYAIYPNKRCLREEPGSCAASIGQIACHSGLTPDFSRADSLKMANLVDKSPVQA